MANRGKVVQYDCKEKELRYRGNRNMFVVQLKKIEPEEGIATNGLGC